METNTQGQPSINAVYTNTDPSLAEQSDEQQQPAINKVEESEETLEEISSPNRKKYHSSARFAANAWHSTMQHVKKNHNHSGLNL